jgi:hypothetical protein
MDNMILGKKDMDKIEDKAAEVHCRDSALWLGTGSAAVFDSWLWVSAKEPPASLKWLVISLPFTCDDATISPKWLPPYDLFHTVCSLHATSFLGPCLAAEEQGKTQQVKSRWH